MMTRRFLKTARQVVPEYFPFQGRGINPMSLYSSKRGELGRDTDIFWSAKRDLQAKVLIVCGWEWACKNWYEKNRLIYFLREFAEESGMAIIIYSQATTDPVVGRIDRGGVGKLASIALSIVRLEEEETPEEQEEKVPTISP